MDILDNIEIPPSSHYTPSDPPFRYNAETVKLPRSWWQILLRIPVKEKVRMVLIPYGTPEYETATYEEVIVYGRPIQS